MRKVNVNPIPCEAFLTGSKNIIIYVDNALIMMFLLPARSYFDVINGLETEGPMIKLTFGCHGVVGFTA